jgi:predicted DNA-binding transcriptional regulator YafY
MGKTERLLQMYLLLRSKRTAITAQTIANAFGTSLRTVYRDIESLSQAGISVKGEAGIGYLVGKDNEIAPLMFTKQEILSITVGLKMVKAFTDPELASAATQSELKIQSILTDSLKHFIEHQPYHIPIVKAHHGQRQLHGQLRLACQEQRKVLLDYKDSENTISQRTVWPLGVFGWTGRWTVLAYCELRQHYRNFRFDRIDKVTDLAEPFITSPTVNLAHYFETVMCKEET